MARLAIGFTTGIVMVHQRRQLPSQAVAKKRREPKPGTYSFFMRGAHEKSHDPDDYLLMPQKKQKLAAYDVLLRKFRYGDALDKVLETRQPQNVSKSMLFHILLNVMPYARAHVIGSLQSTISFMMLFLSICR